MTAALSATDPLARDKIMASANGDPNEIDYSSTDYKYWKEKYLEEADVVRETQAELDEFQISSKELEAELEADLARTEKAKMELMVKVERAEMERDEWKAKFVALQTTHNTTTASLQRELDQLRQVHHSLKIQMRDLEMGNDDLERNERAITSSLADVEAKYGKTLEEKILLEHDLLDKANVEEECQRLKDEVRDASLEITVLRDQLTQARAYAKAQKRASTYDSSTSGTTSFKPTIPSSENILTQRPPSDLNLDDLSPAIEDAARQFSRSSSESSTNYATSRNVSSSPTDSSIGHEALMKRAGLPPAWAKSPASSDRTATLTRSQTFSSFIPSRLPTGNPSTSTPRPAPTSRLPTSASTSSATTSKNRGVQMVSEMRARVRNLEQRLHTRVPRLRMGSISMKKSETAPATASGQGMASGSPEFKTPEHIRIKRRSVDVEYERKAARDGDTSGWVLIMEDNMSPSPTKDRDKERRRLSSPTSSPSPYSMSSRSTNRTSSSKTSNTSTSIADANIGKGRPESRQSGTGRDSMSTVSTGSSISTPTSRPTSPAFLSTLSTPPPGFTNSALPLLKRSVTVQKRASLGRGSPTRMPYSYLQPPTSYRDKHVSSVNMSSADKSLPPTPKSATRISRPPSAVVQSKIGRPTPLVSGRRSTGSETTSRGLGAKDLARWRSGSGAR
ncbi:NDE1_1 [Sanghuangporus weigelae]